MRIGIIGAMKVEIELIKEGMKLIEEVEHVGFTFFIGKINGIELVLTSCGVGKVNAACCTQILIDKFNVHKIINTGVAGSLHNDVKICHVVIGNDVTYHDARKEQMKNLFPFKEKFKCDETLINIAMDVCENKLDYHIGRIVTGEAFVSDPDMKKFIIKEYDPLCVEMEGGAIGHVATINNIPFIIIRSISDNSDDDTGSTYERFEKVAANNSARLVLGIINRIM